MASSIIEETLEKLSLQAVLHPHAGFTDLHKDSALASINLIRKLIDQGHDIDAIVHNTSMKDWTALHIATMLKESEIIKILLENGADFTLRNADNKTLLHISYKRNRFISIKLILEAFYSCCIKLNENITKSFAEKNIPIDKNINISTRFLQNFKPLHFAIAFHLVDFVKIILKNGIDIEVKDSNGMTALHCTVQNLQMGLLKKDYIYKSLSSTNSHKNFDVFPQDLVKILDLLLNHKHYVNTLDIFNRTPLFYLFYMLNYKRNWKTNLLNPTVRKDILSQLLSFYLDFNVKDIEENTILFMMAKIDKNLLGFLKGKAVKIVKACVRGGVNLDEVDNFGYTPLHYACSNCNTELVTALLNHGADANFTRSRTMERPIHSVVQLSAKFGSRYVLDMLMQLLKHGAYLDSSMTNGMTPILIASNVPEKSAGTSVVTCLLVWGCEVNCTDFLGRTPLHYVFKHKNANMIDLFLKHGANLNALDIYGYPPLAAFYSNNFTPSDSLDFYSYLKRLLFFGVPLHYINMKIYLYSKGNVEKTAVLMNTWVSTLNQGFAFSEFEQKLKNIPSEEQCKTELNIMKIIRIGSSNITLYDILHKSPNDLVYLLNNENRTNILAGSYFDDDFPIYGYLIKKKIKDVKKVLILVKSAEKSLLSIFQIDVPSAFYKILMHLENKDLINLIKANA